jgi:hypothetical protein
VSFALPSARQADADVGSVLTPAWESFVTAAEAYRADRDDDYPRDGDPCLYCHQPLVGSALDLVRRYRDYTSGELRQRARVAQEELSRLAEPMQGLSIETLIERLRRDGEDLTMVDAVEFLLVEAQGLQSVLRTGSAGELPPWTGPDPLEVLEDMAPQERQAQEAHDALAARAEERATALQAETTNLHELESRLTLKGLLEPIRAYVRDVKWAHRAVEQASRLSGVARSLTVVSNRASEDLLNADFEQRFEAERKALRAPEVTLEFPGRRGQPTRRKSVTAGHRLREVLSEGEQKVIALADFLAEAGLHKSSAPLIFDDPVNSLDYKRLQHVVDRLIEISSTHQVVVFTHNIWFATELLAHFDKDKTSCDYILVSGDGPVKGLLSAGAGPRSDGIKATAGKINKVIQDAGTVSGETRSALVERAYDYIRNWCEVVAEQELLAKVTQRYQPNVAMTQLANIRSDRLDAAISVILPAYEKACRVIAAHSQPLETLNVRPDLDELKNDWEQLVAARAAYLAP